MTTPSSRICRITHLSSTVTPKNQKAASRRRYAMDGEIARTWPVVLKYFRIFGWMCVLSEAKEKILIICYLSIPQWSVILVCFYKKEKVSSKTLKQQLGKKSFSVRPVQQPDRWWLLLFCQTPWLCQGDLELLIISRFLADLSCRILPFVGDGNYKRKIIWAAAVMLLHRWFIVFTAKLQIFGLVLLKCLHPALNDHTEGKFCFYRNTN